VSLVVLVTVAWLALLVGPATGATRGSTRLSAPEVSPRSGTTRTIVAFTVVYRNREGSPPDWVRVTVAGATHQMQALDPLDRVKDGIRFAYRGKLPAGAYPVTFSSRGRDKFQDSLAGGTVTIKKPSSGGSGGSGGGSGGSGGGSGGTGGGGSSGGSGGSAGSSGSSNHTAPSAGSSSPADAPIAPVVPAPVAHVSPLYLEPDDVATGQEPGGALPGEALPGAIIALLPAWLVPASSGVQTDPQAGSQTGPLSGSQAGPDAGGGRGAGSQVEAPRIPGLRLPGDQGAELLATTLLTSAATTLTLAFLIFGKRKRDEEQPAPDGELAQAAALPYGFASAGALAYAPAAAPAPRTVPAFDPGTGGTDVDLPRWRRPSLLAARKYDPLRDGGAAPHLTFDAYAAPGGARERRIVRYRIVRLLDRPDEMLGVELGTLDEGDEVEILDQHGTYRRVMTPDGREGWVHKMTLGELVGDEVAAAASDSEIDPDVLLAYMAARAHN
jgi:hypothetical protein